MTAAVLLICKFASSFDEARQQKGFDPLIGGFRPVEAEMFNVFSTWIEVLPTDQIVAVAVDYDPKTGRQR